jgi:tetratricopeptide (TPR) repeat protein
MDHFPSDRVIQCGPGVNLSKQLTEEEFETLIKSCERPLANARGMNDLDGITLELLAIANLQCHRGNFSEAAKLYEEIVDKYRSKCCASPSFENYTKAAEVHEHAFYLFKKTGQRDLALKTMFKLGQFYSKLKKYDKATDVLMEVRREGGNSRLSNKADEELKLISQKRLLNIN